MLTKFKNWIKDKWLRFKKWLFALFMVPVALAGGEIADQQINPYTDKVDRLEMAIVQDIPDAGEAKVELLKDRPEVRLKKWNGEVDLGVSYSKVKGKGSRAFLTNRMEWKDQKEEVHAYPKENGNFEIEVVLKEKPDTNRFEFAIDGYQELDFSYQPELTQEEKDQGAERPENVVGSYAVYHKAKANHCANCDKVKVTREFIRADGTSTTTLITATNYATGKAFHIFRPKVTDNNGRWVWGELDYTEGVLTVTVPQDFLDTAIYPVLVDPTFGYTTGGASGSGNMNDIFASVFALSEAATVTKMTAYCSHFTFDTYGFVKTLIINHSNHNIVTNGISNPVQGTSDLEWKDYTFATNPTLSAGDYDLGAIWDGGALSWSLRFDSGSANQGFFDGSNDYTTPTNPTDGSHDSTNKYSIYATYTAGGEEPPAATSTSQSEYFFN